MLNILLVTAIRFLVFAAAIWLPAVALWAILRYWESKQQHRFSPLPSKFQRSAGQSVRERLSDIRLDVIAAAFGIFVMPLVGGAYGFWMQLPPPSLPPTAEHWSVAGIVLIACILLGLRLWKLLGERKNLQHGLEGEVYVAAELNKLMLEGCRVFHDIVLTHGNIDHVVVSPSGVMAIETKVYGRLKDFASESKVIVDYEKGKLRFPDRVIPIPAPQAIRQAEVLAKILTESVGEKIEVEPMIALPGWFIEKRIGKPNACVLNPTNAHSFFIRTRRVLSSESIQRIAYQLGQRTSDLEPEFSLKRSW